MRSRHDALAGDAADDGRTESFGDFGNRFAYKCRAASDANHRLFCGTQQFTGALYFFAGRDWVNYLDERYYFVFYPVVFLIAGKGVSFIYDLVEKHNKKIAIILVVVILGFGAYQNITHANQILDVKKDSYIQLKMAGEFINENTNPDDFLLILEEPAEITYYAPREYIHIGGGKNESFIRESIKEYKPKYATLSFYVAGGAPDYYEAINFVFAHPEIFKPVQAYPPYIDQEQKIPLAAVFEINPEYY